MSEPAQPARVDLGHDNQEAESLFVYALREFAPKVFEDLRDRVLLPQAVRRGVRHWAERWHLLYRNGEVPEFIITQVRSILEEWHRHPRRADELLFNDRPHREPRARPVLLGHGSVRITERHEPAFLTT